MPRATSLAFLAFVLTFSHLLLPCTSLSQDGLLLIEIGKAEWIYPHNTPIFCNWNGSDQNPCGWNGISCDKFNTVTKIDLKGAHILGNLTSAICRIPKLTVLILEENKFSHLQNLSRCKRLRKLNLLSNELSGWLHSSISQLRGFRELNLGYNYFGGDFPDDLLHYKHLRKFDLSSNRFTGMLPSSISELSLLTELTLAYNDFSGPFPDALFNCKHLRKLDLSHNKFVGALPSRISELSELRELNLALNSFAGSIPPSFGILPQLESLFLHENSLNGTFLNFVGNLKSLVSFTFYDNPLRPSVLPRELGNLKQLQSLWLPNCNFVGGIPDTFGSLTELDSLDLSYKVIFRRV